ncbi:hypothetical protein GOODEAATRI_025000, partial [Goodea atripinnis]
FCGRRTSAASKPEGVQAQRDPDVFCRLLVPTLKPSMRLQHPERPRDAPQGWVVEGDEHLGSSSPHLLSFVETISTFAFPWPSHCGVFLCCVDM